MQELKQVFHGAKEYDVDDLQSSEGSIWDQIMDEVDRDNDNLISYDEFYESMVAVIMQRSSSV